VKVVAGVFVRFRAPFHWAFHSIANNDKLVQFYRVIFFSFGCRLNVNKILKISFSNLAKKVIRKGTILLRISSVYLWREKKNVIARCLNFFSGFGR
jgi:hypothetical protein